MKGTPRNEHVSTVLWQRRVSRRRLLGGAGVVLGTAAVGGAIGCQGSSELQTKASSPPATKGTPTLPAPRPGGTLNLAATSQLADLHPQVGAYPTLWVNQYVYDHLFVYDYVNGKAELLLAQSIENPDPMNFIFKIKSNAKFQNVPPVNGRGVTSEDVVASWDAFLNNPRAANKRLFTDNVDRYETPNASTLVVKMKLANAWAIGPHAFGGPLPTVVIPKELIDKNAMATTAIGAGGYLLDQFDPTKSISFKKRPDGWHTGDGRPYIDKVVFTLITDAAARSAALRSKQIDLLPARDRLEAEEFKSFGLDMKIDRELTYPSMFYMRSDKEGGLFFDPRVREAVYNALDIKELIDRVELGEAEWSGPVPPYLKAWSLPADELKKAFPHDVQKAKQLLAAAAWNSAREVELKYRSDEKSALLCEVLQQQLNAIGIKTKLVPQDMNTIWLPQTMNGRDFQLSAASSYIQGADPSLWLGHIAGQGAIDFARWTDPELTDLYERQRAEFDANKQRNLILDAERLALRRFAPIVNLYAPYAFTGRWSHLHTVTVAEKGHAGTYGHYNWTEKA